MSRNWGASRQVLEKGKNSKFGLTLGVCAPITLLLGAVTGEVCASKPRSFSIARVKI